MENKLKNLIAEGLMSLGIESGEVTIEHPADLSMGDYSTNVAMAFAKVTKQNPKEFAEKLVEEIKKDLPLEVEKVEAKNGFVNFYLSTDFFFSSVKDIIQFPNFGHNESYRGKKIMVEYTQPNPFKPFHIGHLMSNAIGESISRIMEYSSADVVRANYQGDVGPHVAKAIYGLQQNAEETWKYIQEENYTTEVARYIGECYAQGAEAYETYPNAKKEIDEINKKIYAKSDEEINKIYDWGFRATMGAFDEIYQKLGTKFDYYFLESEMAPIGEEIVKHHPEVFENSEGAIVFKGEKYDPKLHTRVFINSQDLPTYETKEIGLTLTKFEKENPDLSIVTTAVEQADYMKVVRQAIELMYPDLAGRMMHVTHGMMRFASGKMSSRKGNVVTGESLINDARVAVLEKIKDRLISDEELAYITNAVGIAAVKYSILKQAIGSDIVYDFEKSISFDGDSGPYLQYSFARAHSVVAKGKSEGIEPGFSKLPASPHDLEKMLYRFPEVVLRASREFEPHYIANYLIEIARLYNSFYNQEQIVNKEDEFSSYKLALSQAFSVILKKGLHLLGIVAPEKM